MRRQPATKIVHPKKDELKKIVNELNSAKLVISRLKKEVIPIKKEIEKLKEEEKLSLEKKKKVDALVKNSELLLIEADKKLARKKAENVDYDKEKKILVSERDGFLDKMFQAKDDFEATIFNLEKNAQDKKKILDKEILSLTEQVDNKLKELKNAGEQLRKIDSAILEKETAVEEIENTIIDKVENLEKIETALGSKLDEYKKYIVKVDQLDGQEASKLLKIQATEKKLKELESKKTELERDVRLKKEQSISTVMREVQLKKKEDRLRKMYEKVGLAFNL